MDIARMMGIMIVFGVPAIIGGGLVFHLFESWVVVWFYELALIAVAGGTAYFVAGKAHDH